MIRRRRRSRARRLNTALRVLCAIVLALFVGQSALAYAAPCIPDEHGESCPDEDKEKCPCPLQCASCCAGNALRAIPPEVPLLDVPLPASVEVPLSITERAPPPSEPAEILHVPKRNRA